MRKIKIRFVGTGLSDLRRDVNDALRHIGSIGLQMYEGEGIGWSEYQLIDPYDCCSIAATFVNIADSYNCGFTYSGSEFLFENWPDGRPDVPA
jgi:hypothetical protein